ncbi:MAG: (R,R)-butanediol dehydrogenase / meso-butanediol dehydrogenase / diacetyl reductase [Solirubrobacterales bacterium]|nr:(R,R)-butanediol dehydrogenase / meso-butanediol dehydrogenase / diacetyl reductase [Solirubrobacterales bacterium]
MRWHAAGDVRLDEVELALPLGPGMIEAEVAYTGICGSDVAEFKAPFAIRPGKVHPLTGQEPPVTLGHEFSAVVTEVGEGVEGVKPGDRVSADACWRCNECEACVSGRYNLCRFSGSIGLSSDGAFAPLVRFPAYCAVPLPDGVSDEVGALLEPLAVGLHALDRGGARAGERLVVIGYGPIGACTALVARSLGLEALVLEMHPGRRARAEQEGFATYEPAAEPREVARGVRGMTGGLGAEIVVDCSGAVPALEAALEMTTRGGRIVVAGIPKQPLPLDAGRMVLYERSLHATLGYANDLPRVAAMIAAGLLEPQSMITRRIPLAETPDELARLAENPGDDVKVLVEVGP